MTEPDVPQLLDYRGRTAFADGSEAPGDPGPAAEADAGDRRYRHPAGNTLGIRCRWVHTSERHREQHSRIQVPRLRTNSSFFRTQCAQWLVGHDIDNPESAARLQTIASAFEKEIGVTREHGLDYFRP